MEGDGGRGRAGEGGRRRAKAGEGGRWRAMAGDGGGVPPGVLSAARVIGSALSSSPQATPQRARRPKKT